ncbi:MAG TPA: hypothetical protein VHT97_04920 [Acidimicrobiales bacterium]|jgi:hypothetical protein|nr:hypothetical protein [Acidimicrobiales bacterium]
MRDVDVDRVALCRGLLQNAAARQLVFSRAEPEVASAEYLTGFGAGWEAGHVSALALALSVLTGESPAALVEDARAQAAVDLSFPFDVHIEEAS